MAKAFQPAVLTANALLTGEAVWWTGAGWSPRFAEARVADTPEQAGWLEALGTSPLFAAVIVGAYLSPVRLTEAGPVPANRREAIRTAGEPSFDYLLQAVPRTPFLPASQAA